MGSYSLFLYPFGYLLFAGFPEVVTVYIVKALGKSSLTLRGNDQIISLLLSFVYISSCLSVLTSSSMVSSHVSLSFIES